MTATTKNNTVTNRRTGVELLRIILFFQVVAIHVTTTYFGLNNAAEGSNWLVSDVTVSFSRCAVNCFVVITGYFGAQLGFSGQLNKIKRLLLALCGYLSVFFIYFLFINRERGVGDLAYSAKFLITDLFTLGGYFYHMWYLFVLCVVLLIAAFLNAGARTVSSKELRYVTVVLFLLLSVVPTVHYMLGVTFLPFDRYLCDFTLFIMLYLFGVRIKLADFGRKWSKKTCFVAAFLSLFGIAALTYLYNSPYSPYLYLGGIRGFTVTYPFDTFIGIFFANEHILDVLGALFLFLLFLKIDVKHKFLAKCICFVSKATFGGYILHTLFIYVMDEFPSLRLFAHVNGTFYPLYLAAYIAIAGTASLIIPMTVRAVATLIRRKQHGATSG